MEWNESKEHQFRKAIWGLAEKYPVDKLEKIANGLLKTELGYIRDFINNVKELKIINNNTCTN